MPAFPDLAESRCVAVLREYFGDLFDVETRLARFAVRAVLAAPVRALHLRHQLGELLCLFLVGGSGHRQRVLEDRQLPALGRRQLDRVVPDGFFRKPRHGRHVRGVGACGHRLGIGRDVRVLHPACLAGLIAEPEHRAVGLGQKGACLVCGGNGIATLARGHSERRDDREHRESFRAHGAIIEAPLTSGKGGVLIDEPRVKRTYRILRAIARHHPRDAK